MTAAKMEIISMVLMSMSMSSISKVNAYNPNSLAHGNHELNSEFQFVSESDSEFRNFEEESDSQFRRSHADTPSEEEKTTRKRILKSQNSGEKIEEQRRAEKKIEEHSMFDIVQETHGKTYGKTKAEEGKTDEIGDKKLSYESGDRSSSHFSTSSEGEKKWKEKDLNVFLPDSDLSMQLNSKEDSEHNGGVKTFSAPLDYAQPETEFSLSGQQNRRRTEESLSGQEEQNRRRTETLKQKWDRSWPSVILYFFAILMGLVMIGAAFVGYTLWECKRADSHYDSGSVFVANTLENSEATHIIPNSEATHIIIPIIANGVPVVTGERINIIGERVSTVVQGRIVSFSNSDSGAILV